MFWLPRGWAPYYAEWLLSFPRAPLGSVSVNMWVLASAAVILLTHDAVVAAVRSVAGSGAVAGPEKRGEKVKVKVPVSAGAVGEKTDAQARDAGGSKKEI